MTNTPNPTPQASASTVGATLNTKIPANLLKTLPDYDKTKYVGVSTVEKLMDTIFGFANWDRKDSVVHAPVRYPEIRTTNKNGVTTTTPVHTQTLTGTSTVRVRLPDGRSITRRATSSAIAVFVDGQPTLHVREVKRAEGDAVAAAFKRACATLGAALGRGLEKDGNVSDALLAETDEPYSPPPAAQPDAEPVRPAPVPAQTPVKAAEPPVDKPVAVSQPPAPNKPDMGMTIGSAPPAPQARPNAVPIPRPNTTLSNPDDYTAYKPFFAAPGALPTIDDFKAQFANIKTNAMRATKIKTLDELLVMASEWKEACALHGLFKNTVISKPLTDYFKYLQDSFLDKRALIDDTPKAANG